MKFILLVFSLNLLFYMEDVYAKIFMVIPLRYLYILKYTLHLVVCLMTSRNILRRNQGLR